MTYSLPKSSNNSPVRSLHSLSISSLLNSVLRTSHHPFFWKFSTMIVFLKARKSPHSFSSYCPIRLLPLLFKIRERILLKRILPFLEFLKILLEHPFPSKTFLCTAGFLCRISHFLFIREGVLHRSRMCCRCHHPAGFSNIKKIQSFQSSHKNYSELYLLCLQPLPPHWCSIPSLKAANSTHIFQSLCQISINSSPLTQKLTKTSNSDNSKESGPLERK